MLTYEEFKKKVQERPEVKAEYDRLADEFALLDEFLKARAVAGVTQEELAKRMGTTQSVIARLESGKGKHSPTLATLQKYARALGCRLEVHLTRP
ncbi:MAG: helix-turn-helix transcriptional regulator [Syntrophorhabdaceae bacterium]|nr:helix-turn-helix domain-containing protein [Syntrophorhabdaceae bacterium]MDD4197211.1 helix-turn-helix transcriptional regulator [Syntrophorhabdaceae bacterium]